jgi:2-polyprenyl-6-methoxyphenol hydroxylase-like FAD-dependent oxidoreductase
MLPAKTEVLVVGAGPTGLALANMLHSRGIDYVVVDKLTEGLNTSRAAVIHAHTLEALESIGVSQHLVDLGLRLSTFSIRDKDRALLSLDFSTLRSRYPYLLMLPQDVTERVLRDRLTSRGGTIHGGVTVEKALQSADGVGVTLSTPEGDREIVARYVVGADGMHSVIRQAADIPFEGGAYAESFVLADVRMDWPMRQEEVSLYFSPAGLVVVAPLPGGSHRIVATLDPAPEHPNVSDIQSLLDARGPERQKAKVQEVTWSSRFKVHHRLAASYRRCNLFLIGDAAHVHSPAGGQGMNCGLVDACVLGELFADVLQAKRPEAALDNYESLRRPAAAAVLSLAGRLTGMATVRNRWQRVARNIALSAVDHLKPAKQRILENLSGLSRRQLSQLPSVTTR